MRSSLLKIPITLLRQSTPTNGRVTIDDARVAALMADFAAVGQLHAITVIAADDAYRIVAGNHRYTAAYRLGWQNLDCHVVTLTPVEEATVRLNENLTRCQLSPFEEACQLQELLTTCPGGIDEVARRVHRKVTWILGRLELLTLPDPLPQLIHLKKLPLATALELGKIEQPETRATYLALCLHNGATAATVRTWRRELAGLVLTKNDPAEKTTSEPNFQNTTQIFVECATCGSSKELRYTRPVNLCTDCLIEIHKTRATERIPE